MTKRILSLLLVTALSVAVFSGCKKQQEAVNAEPVTQATTQIIEDTTGFKISYTQSDSLNPYEADTQNNEVAQDLVYESLFRLDESLDVQPEIANSYSFEDSKTLVVTIVDGLKFSNGDLLTADDVVNAFNLAKKSPLYENMLSVFTNASVLGSTAVRFNLSFSDPYAYRLLTFKIAKQSGEEKYMLGSGRYMFTEGEGNVYAEVNKNYKEQFTPRFTKIQLVNVPATDSINNALNIGNISYAYRAPGSDDISSLKCNQKRINQNNLVYIGINSSSSPVSNEDIRRAVSLAVDRSVLVKSSYQGKAKPAVSIYHPASDIGRQTAMFSETCDTAGAKQAIAKSGYSSPSLVILVNDNTLRISVAHLVKQQLEAVGFSVSIKQLNNEAYLNSLEQGSYDIYIGETKIPADMRLTEFFSKDGAVSYGINQESNCAISYSEYLDGEREIGGFTLEFSNEMPFVPLLYRDGVICYSRMLRGDIQGCYGNFFSNIEDWYYN